MKDPWVQLGHLIDWSRLEKDFSSFYCADNGRPGGSIRLMVGLCIIKNKEGISNEQVCNRWQRDPYFQYFCGEQYFQHHLPVKPQSLSNFYLRIGEEGQTRLLGETIKVGLVSNAYG